VLRVKCPPVQEFDEELRRLAGDMIDTMHAAPGVGLAAPQVGVELRILVADLTAGEDPEALVVLVNPEILSPEGQETELEGCLSIPGFSEKVDRPARIDVKAQALTGETLEFTAEGWLARVICHEVDHLDGVLFVDRLRGLRKERARRQLKRMAREAAESSPPEAASPGGGG
jgi:peptide deformylase